MPLPPLPPPIRGIGQLPRYGSGWMHQFGHVYCLQQEMLTPKRSDWFRACELWHVARHEGIALNVAHYNSILRQVVPAAQWFAALQVLEKMRTSAVRPDANTVASVLASCADAGRWEEAIAVESHFKSKGLKLNGRGESAIAKARTLVCNYSAIEPAAATMQIAEGWESTADEPEPVSVPVQRRPAVKKHDDELRPDYSIFIARVC